MGTAPASKDREDAGGTAGAREFTTMSFNLRFGLANDGDNSWPARKSSVAALLQRHPADFICLQESHDFQAVFIKCLLQSHDFIGLRSPAPRFWQNNVIFYNRRWRLLEKSHFFLSPTPDVPSRFRRSRWPRQCTIGRFEEKGRQLLCVNTHLDFAEQVQEQSARIILESLARWPATPSAVIAGDFNSSPSGACHAVFTSQTCGGDLPETEKHYFRNVFDRQCPPGTYHAFTGTAVGECIDWILYRGNILPTAANVIREPFDGRFPSDHFPIRATFQWRV